MVGGWWSIIKGYEVIKHVTYEDCLYPRSLKIFKSICHEHLFKLQFFNYVT